MKIFFNIYLLTAVVISLFIFFFSYQLRLQPMYQFKIVGEKFFVGKNFSNAYSTDYLHQLKTAYFHQPLKGSDSIYNASWVNSIPNDSIFSISFQQIVKAGFLGYFDFPTITSENQNTLVSRFHVKAQKNFDIVITLKKMNNDFVCHKIENLPLLLYYYPDNRKAFEKFNGSQK